MGEPQVTRTNRARRRKAAVIAAVLGSLLFCCVLSIAPLAYLVRTDYLQAGPPGWRYVELPTKMAIHIPDGWIYSTDAENKNVVIADASGTVLFYGFYEGTYYDAVMVRIDRYLEGYEFVWEAQQMTNEVSTWHELIYRDIDTGETVTVQVINTRGSGMYRLYSVPDIVDRNTARKMAFS